jgi:hypothetical protein
MTTDQPPLVESRPTRSNRRLRALLVLSVLSLGLYLFVRLDRSAVEHLGPVVVGVYDLFNQVPGRAPPLTAAGTRFVKDVEALGGEPSVNVIKPGFLGTIGQIEWCDVTVRNGEFDDAALAQLGDTHGGRIGGLYLENSGVTDAGLRHLGKFTMLRHLSIRDYRKRTRPGAELPPKFTDAGLIHLKGLDHLWTLTLSGLPVTDAGLAAVNGSPELNALYLSNTKVQGHGFAQLKSLPQLAILYLDGSAMTEDGLKALSGATSLQLLSLNQVPLTPDALPLLKAIPRVDRLELTGCGFLDEEVADLVKSKPGLKVMRK